MALKPEFFIRPRVLYPAIATAGIAVLIMFYFFDPVEHEWLPQCLFHRLTGLYCAGCGAGRGLHALLHGDIAGSFAGNPLLLPLFLTVALLLWKPKLTLNPYIAWGIVIVILLFTILRNIPLFSFLAPH